jgi:amino acid transporter
MYLKKDPGLDTEESDSSQEPLSHELGDAPAQRPDPNAVIEPVLVETVHGAHPGDRTVRIPRAADQKLRRLGERAFEATRNVLRPNSRLGRLGATIRRILIGPPLASSALVHERLSKLKALAIFSSDNLSSSAYATEEMLLVLILAGSAGLTYALPIAFVISLLVAIVALSYTQLIRAYPRGGGAYDVTRNNIGQSASLLAGAALCVDFILTVAVSTAAGVAAVTSAVPELEGARVPIAIGCVTLLTIGNLRGIRESGTIFAIPSYFFILSFGGMIAVGFIRLALGADLHAATTTDPVQAGTRAVTLFLVLRAFSSGASALTGIEALAEGVPSFKPPETRNAATTLAWMVAILATFFIGTTILARHMGVLPDTDTTVVSQIASTVFGHNVFYYAVQSSTALILVLAANTAFAGLPTLASVMAHDGVMPRQFAFRGDRLAFSNGILVLGAASSVVLVIFHASTHELIPLYAFGVFVAFTFSQAGMVIHWRKTRTPRWRLYALINGVGAAATGIVAVIVGATKFADGAWLSMLAVAILCGIFWLIQSHYHAVEEQLSVSDGSPEPLIPTYLRPGTRGDHTAVVLIDGLNRASLRAAAYAHSLPGNAIAVHVTDDHAKAEALRRDWEEAVPDIPLTIVESPYRALVQPLMAFIDSLRTSQPDQAFSIVLADYEVKHLWQRPLHDQLGHRLRNAILKRPDTVVIGVPFHFQR